MDLKKKTKSLPLRRLLIYIAAIVSLPFFFVGYHFYKEKKEWESAYQQICFIQSLSESKAQKQSLNNLIRRLYKDSDSSYFTNQLENLSFLKKEKEALENMMRHPAFTGNEAAEKRYGFIVEGKNCLRFTESSSQSAEGVSETVESLAHAIEIDADDLKELLFRIEGNKPGKPLLLITDFKLTKKEQLWGNEIFELNLKLLKREFLQ